MAKNKIKEYYPTTDGKIYTIATGQFIFKLKITIL